MKFEKFVFVALEFIVIVLLSWVSTYGLQFIEFVAPVDAFSLRNIICLMSIGLSFYALYHRSKSVAFVFSLFFSITILLLLTTQSIVLDLPLTAFFLATIIGVLSVILSPTARGKEFFAFLAILILPLLLAESSIIGWMTVQEMERSLHQTYPMILMVIGGCLYLRYATEIKLMEKEQLSKGGDLHELAIIRSWSNIFAITIIACAMGVNAVLAEFVIAIINQLSYQPGESFIFLLIFAGIAGVAILSSIYVISDKLAKR
jgi:hypothetical protein